METVLIHFKDNGCPNWKKHGLKTSCLGWKEFVKKAQEDPGSYCNVCIEHNTGSFYMRFLLFVNNVAPFIMALLVIAAFASPFVLCVMADRAQKECQSRKCTTGSPVWMRREGKCLCMILPE